MKIQKKQMKLAQKLFYSLSFILLIGAFIFLGTRNYKVKELPDNVLFNKEFKNVPIDNVFKVFDSVETLTFLENGTGILFLGFPENIWSAPMAELLNSSAKEANFPALNYFNFLNDRSNHHTNYDGIVREIDDYLVRDDEGVLNIYAPLVVGILKGNVIFYENDTAFMNNLMTPKDYWTEDKKEEMKLELMDMMETMKGMLANAK